MARERLGRAQVSSSLRPAWPVLDFFTSGPRTEVCHRLVIVFVSHCTVLGGDGNKQGSEIQSLCHEHLIAHLELHKRNQMKTPLVARRQEEKEKEDMTLQRRPMKSHEAK